MLKITLFFLLSLLATFLMDIANLLLSMASVVQFMNLNFIGNLLYEWSNGNFIFSSPLAVHQHTGSLLYGYIFHYFVGGTLGTIILFYLPFNKNKPSKKLIFLGTSCSLISLIIIYPSIGIGFFAVNKGFNTLYSCVLNHFLFGFSLYLSYSIFMYLNAFDKVTLKN